MDNQNPNKPYDYLAAGFSPFLTRSIDDIGSITLDHSTDQAAFSSQEINYDQSQTTGSLGSFIQVGNIRIDGQSGRISIFDENNNEVVRIGAL